MKAIVLAAGKGTRLQTEGIPLPKVMRSACGRPLLSYVLQELDFLSPGEIAVVVGYRKENVIPAFPGYRFAEQKEQLGTGHAVLSASGLFAGYQGPVLVCCGDMPLMKKSTYQALIRTHLEEGNLCTVLTGRAEHPLPYGRVIRDGEGRFLAIREEKDCNAEEREIRELNSGVYVFDAETLFSALPRLKNSNAQGEYYLTDVPSLILSEGGRVGICEVCGEEEMLGVNTPDQLREVEEQIRRRKA